MQDRPRPTPSKTVQEGPSPGAGERLWDPGILAGTRQGLGNGLNWLQPAQPHWPGTVRDYLYYLWDLGITWVI